MNTGREIKKKLESPPQWNYRGRYNPGLDCLYLEIGHRIRDFTLLWWMGLGTSMHRSIMDYDAGSMNIFSVPHKKQIPIFRTARFR
ncbi:hypothetical protein DTO045G8_2129 [Paecilomyces variotii]|nr:hypothetical protein DTO045G8_2129 [Paecilomyces variotii]